jgi:rRNA maturation protein Rpf1
MKVTTSRDPSAKARRLGKTVAMFLSLPYVNRGKQRLDDEETWLVVVEDHGNPKGIVKRTPEEEEHLNFALALSSDHRQRLHRRLRPVVIGQNEESERIARFFELGRSADPLNSHKRIILVESEKIDFVDEDEIVLRLKT